MIPLAFSPEAIEALRVEGYHHPHPRVPRKMEALLLKSQEKLSHREIAAPEKIKYSLSNAAPTVGLCTLARRQGQRYWVERALQDGKSEAGLDHYQVRKWQGWHHHMTLVMMAMLFMLEERRLHRHSHPLLSAYDVRLLLSHFLPKRDTSSEEVLRQMAVRHKQRQAAIQGAARRQRNRQLCAFTGDG